MDEEARINKAAKTKSIKVLRSRSRSSIEDYFKMKPVKDKQTVCEELGFSQNEIEIVTSDRAMLIGVLSEREDLVPNISRLIEALQNEGHYELIDVIKPLIVKDMEADDRFLAHQKTNSSNYENRSNNRQSSNDFLTVQDVTENGNSKYNAVSCRSENPRNDKIIDRLRGSGVKVCDLRRDMLPGVPTYPAEASIIENRAPTVLLMLDKEMLKDQGCSFQMMQAHWLDPDARYGRWIPIKLEADVEIPPFIKHGESLDLSTDEKLEENWEKLLSSIKGSDQRTDDVTDVAKQLYTLKTSNI